MLRGIQEQLKNTISNAVHILWFILISFNGCVLSATAYIEDGNFFLEPTVFLALVPLITSLMSLSLYRGTVKVQSRGPPCTTLCRDRDGLKWRRMTSDTHHTAGGADLRKKRNFGIATSQST